MRGDTKMHTDHKQDSCPHEPAPCRSTGQRIFITSIAVLAVAGMFLLGCFVLGPWLRNRQSDVPEVATTAPVPMTSPIPDTDEAVSVPHRPESRPDSPSVDVTVTEVPVSEPAVAHNNADEAVTDAPVSSDFNSDSVPEPVLTEPRTVVASEPNPASSDHISTVDTDATPALYRVRAGLFADKANADMLSAKLAAAGFAPAIAQVDKSGQRLYSVQVGAFRSRSSADSLAKSLRSSGFEAVVTTEN